MAVVLESSPLVKKLDQEGNEFSRGHPSVAGSSLWLHCLFDITGICRHGAQAELGRKGAFPSGSLETRIMGDRGLGGVYQGVEKP